MLPRRELLYIVSRTNRHPRPSQPVEIDVLLDPLPDMLCRKSGPDHIGDVQRAVIENVHCDTRIVRARQIGIAGSQTRADYSQPLVALALQPVEATADIDHGLP